MFKRRRGGRDHGSRARRTRPALRRPWLQRGWSEARWMTAWTQTEDTDPYTASYRAPQSLPTPHQCPQFQIPRLQPLPRREDVSFPHKVVFPQPWSAIAGVIFPPDPFLHHPPLSAPEPLSCRPFLVYIFTCQQFRGCPSFYQEDSSQDFWWYTRDYRDDIKVVTFLLTSVELLLLLRISEVNDCQRQLVLKSQVLSSRYVRYTIQTLRGIYIPGLRTVLLPYSNSMH